MEIKLFNSLTKTKETFFPINPEHIKMYVCGPTVYDRPHLGNARSIVIYDLWFRLLQRIYPKVTYVRNITDVDDKINAAAKEKGISIQNLTKEITNIFYSDMKELNVLSPTIEPKATDHIGDMIVMIARLIKDGYAYESAGHVLFDVASYNDYGRLSNRSLDEMIAGSRVEIASYKKNPLDFVLWKPASDEDDISSVFESPWSKGRPGWHIECSAMSSKYLSSDFDIHGGGADLQFPHHENEIAQSICANKGSHYAKYWVHNGFLTVNGEKMSKSLKNFFTIHDILDKKVPGVVIRYLLLSSHYHKPLDFNEKALLDAKKSMNKFYLVFENIAEIKPNLSNQNNKFLNEIIAVLSDDLNTPEAFAILHSLVKEIKLSKEEQKQNLIQDMADCLEFLGLFDQKYLTKDLNSEVDEKYILEQIKLRKEAKAKKDYQLSDKIRNDLLADHGIILEDKSGGEIIWSKK